MHAPIEACTLHGALPGRVSNRPTPTSQTTLQSRMSDQQGDPAAPKPKPKPPSRLGCGPTPSSWKPGQSGNPRGRPRAGLAFAERIRERLDPDLVIELALRLASDESVPLERRLASLMPLMAAGYLRPPSDATLTIAQVTSGAQIAARLPDDVLRALLDAHQQARLDGEDTTKGGARPCLPSTTDKDDSNCSPAQDEHDA